MPGEVRLAVDCGGVSTAAVVVWPDGRSAPLEFDGNSLLSSAVYVQPDGDILTGQQAWQAAAETPERLVAAPVRLASRNGVPVAGVDVPAVDLVAATLRRVAAEADLVAAGSVGQVRLVVPAGWGPRRRTWLRQGAHRAGLGQPTLVEAPVAAADHLLATGVRITVGDFVAVCDLGGGFEATVLRRSPAGFEVLSTLTDPDAGGTRIDELLAAALVPAAAGGSSPAADRVDWAVLASVRAAKEALSQHPAVTVALPPPTGAVVVNATVVSQHAAGVLLRAAQVTADAIAAAELKPDQLAGVYCVGGGARLPLAARTLADRLGVPATVVHEPQWATVRGAAAASAGSSTTGSAAAPVPPIRQAVAFAVPGLASLVLLAHFVFTAQWHSGSRILRGPYFYVVANWGQLAMASGFAVLACLAAGTVLASLLAEDGRRAGPAPAVQVGTGIVAAAASGLATGGLYAVVTSLYFGLSISPFLRWAVLPVVPIAFLACVAALFAGRGHAPRQGWPAFLAFPAASVVLAAVGMALVQYSLTAVRWPHLVVWIDVLGRVGGLMLGVAAAIAVVRPRVLRLIVAAPLTVLAAAIVSWRGSGILGSIYLVAVTGWWAQGLWQLIRSPARDPIR